MGKDYLREITIQTAKGTGALLARNMVLFPLRIISSIILARILSPKDFGIFAIGAFIIYELVWRYAHLGLGKALIQKKEPPDEIECQSVFTAQIVLNLVITGSLFLLAPWISQVYQLGPEGQNFIRLFSLILLLRPICCIPISLLERKLRYDLFAQIQTVTELTYRVGAIIFAWRGFQYWSLLWGILISEVLRLLLFFFANPWRIRINIDFVRFKPLLKFGGAFQIQMLCSIFIDNIFALLGGPLFGPGVVGLFSWAFNLVYNLSRVFLDDITSRISFASFSRVQEDREALGYLYERLIKAMIIIIAPLLFILAGCIHKVILHVYTTKWLPAEPIFYAVAIAMVISIVSSLLIPLLNAIGKVVLVSQFYLLWVVFSWSLAIALVRPFGFLGIAYAYLTGNVLVSLILPFYTRRFVRIKWWDCFFKPLAMAIAAGLLVHFLLEPLIKGIVSLCLVLAGSFLFYLGLLVLVEGKGFLKDMIVLAKFLLEQFIAERRRNLWDRYYSKTFNKSTIVHKEIVECLMRYVDLKGKYVLEVGAGRGEDSFFLAQQGAKVIMVDNSKVAIKLLSGKIKSRKENVRLFMSDTRHLSFKSGTFDVVFHQGLLEHFRDFLAVVGEQLRILKKGGYLLIDVPEKINFYTLKKSLLSVVGSWFAGYEKHFVRARLIKEIEDNFTVAKVCSYRRTYYPDVLRKIRNARKLEVFLHMKIMPGRMWRGYESLWQDLENSEISSLIFESFGVVFIKK